MRKSEEFIKKWDRATELAKKEMLDDGDLFDLCEATANLSDEEYEEVLDEFKKDIKYYDDIDTIERWRIISKEVDCESLRKNQ